MNDNGAWPSPQKSRQSINCLAPICPPLRVQSNHSKNRENSEIVRSSAAPPRDLQMGMGTPRKAKAPYDLVAVSGHQSKRKGLSRDQQRSFDGPEKPNLVRAMVSGASVCRFGVWWLALLIHDGRFITLYKLQFRFLGCRAGRRRHSRADQSYLF
jgi:hypothetical protein